MPKELVVDPRVTRQRGRIAFADIPVHAYATPLSEERAGRGDARQRTVFKAVGSALEDLAAATLAWQGRGAP